MLNLDSVPQFLTSAGSSLNYPVLGMSFHKAGEVQVNARYLARQGLIGLLPVGEYRGGDQIALLAEPNQPLRRWHVVRASHIGEGWRTICSRLSLLAAFTLAADPPLQHQQDLRIHIDDILTTARLLGDSDGRAKAIVDVLHDADAYMFDALPSLPLSAADPEGIWTQFEAAYPPETASAAERAAVWRGIIERDAAFAPAQALLLRALLDLADEVDDAAIRQTAWEVFMLNHAGDNAGMVEAVRRAPGWGAANPIIAAAQALVVRGIPVADTPLRAAVEQLARDEAAYDGAAHLGAAEQYLSRREYGRALVACQNAAFWRAYSQEAAFPEALNLALRLARAWKQKMLVDTLALAQPERPRQKVKGQQSAPQPTPAPLNPAIQNAKARLQSEGVLLFAGDTMLIYRHRRWHWLVQSYLGQTKTIVSLSILTEHRLEMLIGNFQSSLDELLVPVASLSEELTLELRCKLLPEAADYHYLLQRNMISIGGGSTTDTITTSTPELDDDEHREITTKILTEGGHGIINFWRTGEEIAEALAARDDSS